MYIYLRIMWRSHSISSLICVYMLLINFSISYSYSPYSCYVTSVHYRWISDQMPHLEYPFMITDRQLILLQPLDTSCGIRGHPLLWLKSYLSGRTQMVGYLWEILWSWSNMECLGSSPLPTIYSRHSSYILQTLLIRSPLCWWCAGVRPWSTFWSARSYWPHWCSLSRFAPLDVFQSALAESKQNAVYLVRHSPTTFEAWPLPTHRKIYLFFLSFQCSKPWRSPGQHAYPF